MTSGKRKTPQIIKCVTCQQIIEHYGNSRRMYCSPRCKYPDRHTGYNEKRKLTPGQKAENSRQQNRKRYLAHKAIVTKYKLDQGKCADCGLEINERTIICIDLDHRNPKDKTFTIAYKLGKTSLTALIEELNKCDAVCRNCHAYRTYDGQHWSNKLSNPQGNRK